MSLGKKRPFNRAWPGAKNHWTPPFEHVSAAIPRGKGIVMLRDTAHESSPRSASPEATNVDPDHNGIAALAYQLWVLRARTIGSPEVDWFRAEEELKNSMRSVPRAA